MLYKRLTGLFGRILGALLVAAGVTLAAATASASAATTPPLSVTLSACGTGSSATWTATGEPVLVSGSANAGTCGAPAGSTYDPAYAQVVIKGVAGTAVPHSEPTFAQSGSTTSYLSGSGDARYVIDLNNGEQLVGYPPQAGLNGTDMAWAVGNSGTYTSYATAYTAVDGNATTIKDAYIVNDASDQGDALTLTNVQFEGMVLGVQKSGVFVMKNGLSGKCLNINSGNYSATGTTNQYTCDAVWHATVAGAQRFQYETFGDGSQYLVALSPDAGNTGPWFVQATTQGVALSLTSTPVPYVYGTGGYFAWHGLVADDAAYSTSNLTVVWGWPKTGASNQQWALLAP